MPTTPPFTIHGRTLYRGDELIATFWSEIDRDLHDGAHFVTSETKAPQEFHAQCFSSVACDALNNPEKLSPDPLAGAVFPEAPEFVPSAGTLDHFRALIEIARQLAEAANIPASLRDKCATVCENADQSIKREAAFAQAKRYTHDPKFADGFQDEEPPRPRPLLGPAFTQSKAHAAPEAEYPNEPEE